MARKFFASISLLLTGASIQSVDVLEASCVLRDRVIVRRRGAQNVELLPYLGMKKSIGCCRYQTSRRNINDFESESFQLVPGLGKCRLPINLFPLVQMNLAR
jgi:hypothetical protein